MPKVPAISESEWKIMKVLWNQSPLGAYDIIQVLNETEGWHPNTVKTLLSRLHKKKAVATEKYKNLFLYRPLVSAEAYVQAESKSFLDRVFGGSVKPLLIHFVQKQKLSPEDLQELKNILNQQKK